MLRPHPNTPETDVHHTQCRARRLALAQLRTQLGRCFHPQPRPGRAEWLQLAPQMPRSGAVRQVRQAWQPLEGMADTADVKCLPAVGLHGRRGTQSGKQTAGRAITGRSCLQIWQSVSHRMALQHSLCCDAAGKLFGPPGGLNCSTLQQRASLHATGVHAAHHMLRATGLTPFCTAGQQASTPALLPRSRPGTEQSVDELWALAEFKGLPMTSLASKLRAMSAFERRAYLQQAADQGVAAGDPH